MTVGMGYDPATSVFSITTINPCSCSIQDAVGVQIAKSCTFFSLNTLTRQIAV